MVEILDDDLVPFLQWALPKLGYRWRGYRKVRGQVKKRIARRLDELELRRLDDYRSYLSEHGEEWERLDEFCHITISRFYRDRQTWDGMRQLVLPELAGRARGQDRDLLRAWSVGCASGEEPYTLRLCWELDDERPWKDLDLVIDAIDADEHMIERAKKAVYPPGNLKALPPSWRERAFHREDGEYRLRERFRRQVTLAAADLRQAEPDHPCDIVLCRNMAFMYFDAAGREATLEKFANLMVPGGALLVGNHDVVPDRPDLFSPWADVDNTWRRTGSR